MITDASDLLGGSVIFQWQAPNLSDHHSAQFQKCETHGLTPKRILKHNYPSDFLLASIANWNWKWNECRQKYDVYEREILAGILTLSSQFRLIAGRKIIWLCDNKQSHSFLNNHLQTMPDSEDGIHFWPSFSFHLSTFPV